MAKEIFISYSRKDFDKVKAIKDEIDHELGLDCWMDLDGIESGDQFEDVIISAINAHDTMLFMLSYNSMNSQFALDELNFAKMKGKRVVLLFIEPCQMTDKFCFKYSKYDTIDWNDPLQHKKLISNLHKWFSNNVQHGNPTQEVTHDQPTNEPREITRSDPRFDPRLEMEGDIYTVDVRGTTFNMIRVDGGVMEIGATLEQRDFAEKNEYPAHRIDCQTFYMSQFPITQDLWETVMGYNNAKFKGKEEKLSADLEELKSTLGVDTLTTAALLALPAGLLMSAGLAFGVSKAKKWIAEHMGDENARFGSVKGHYPIENITHEEALEFVRRLSQMTNLRFSLPTEDEWEYAARGGRKSRGFIYAGSNSIDEVAWYRNNANDMTHPVGEKKPNELGLYDMCGNVWEWTETPAHSYGLKIEVGGDVYIRRGGSWWHEARNCRVSRRNPTSRMKKTSGLGLRVVIRTNIR